MDDIRELHVLVWFSWLLCIRLAIISLKGLMGSRFSKQVFKSSSLTKGFPTDVYRFLLALQNI